MQTAGLADRVQVQTIEGSPPGWVEVVAEGPQAKGLEAAGIPLREHLEAGSAAVEGCGRNLAARAARALQARCGRADVPAVRIRVHKRIPVAAGLGGGSSDGAAVLRALNRLWGLGLTLQELEVVAASVGADVPFLVRGGTQLARGIGERLIPVASRLQAWCVIVCPRVSLATADVYREWDRLEGRGEGAGEGEGRRAVPCAEVEAEASAMVRALEQGDLERVCGLMANDLAEPAQRLCPAIGAVREALVACGLAGVTVSGSGPAVFGLAPDRGLARQAAHAVRRRLQRERIPSRVWTVRVPPGGMSGS